VLDVVFYRTDAGAEPVREWLKNDLSVEDRKIVGRDIMSVQYRWPLGMPLVRRLKDGVSEVRATVTSGIVRVFFGVLGEKMILLHAISKKTQQTPAADLDLAVKRWKKYKVEHQNAK